MNYQVLKLQLLHALFLFLTLVPATQGSRPTGVRVELATFYNPAFDFKCFDGSNIIPFIQVNDDYCDCEDGSDEPGTSACPNGRFYCSNTGHKALVIPSSRVGDTICDCCDGSDEWESKDECPNTCMEMGRAAREAAEERVKVAMEGYNLRQSMVNEAKAMLEEKKTRIEEMENKKAELEAAKQEKQQVKDEVEAPEQEALEYYKRIEEEKKKKEDEKAAATANEEALKLFSVLDTDNDGSITITELQEMPGIDTNKDGDVSEEEAKIFLGEKEAFDMETFKESGFLLLKPYLELERATTTEEGDNIELTPPVEEYHEPDHPMMTPPPPAHDPDAPDHPMMTPSPETYEDEDNMLETDEDEDEDYDVNDHEEEEVSDTPLTEIVKEETKYDDVTQILINKANEARRAYDAVDREFKDTEREIKELNEVIEKDYGDEGVYAVLSGQCFSHTDNEYTYKMCPFDHCSQKGKHGGSETRLGGWGEWTGPEGDKYSSMKFTGGQGCWNGPARSSLVHLHCGTENTLGRVAEPNKCEYEMHFSTPAACKQPLTGATGHDEL